MNSVQASQSIMSFESNEVAVIENQSIPPGGKIYIASMNMRGSHGTNPPGSTRLNVTSTQRKNAQERYDFSPMTHKEGGYKEFWNFESFWQSGKIFEGVSRSQSLGWWMNVKEPRRRYPKGKGKRVLYATWDSVYPEQMDYVTSRKKVYVPNYYNYIKDSESAKKWKDLVVSGRDVTVYDFDGVRKENGDVDTKEVTLELLKEKIEDTHFPFGHGYVVASLLANIPIESFTWP